MTNCVWMRASNTVSKRYREHSHIEKQQILPPQSINFHFLPFNMYKWCIQKSFKNFNIGDARLFGIGESDAKWGLLDDIVKSNVLEKKATGTWTSVGPLSTGTWLQYRFEFLCDADPPVSLTKALFKRHRLYNIFILSISGFCVDGVATICICRTGYRYRNVLPGHC